MKDERSPEQKRDYVAKLTSIQLAHAARQQRISLTVATLALAINAVALAILIWVMLR